MTDTVKREATRQFILKWQGRGKEDEDDRSFWIDILQDCLGQDHVTDRVEFQKKVIGPDGHTKRIDMYIPETKVLCEQKSLGIALDKPQAGHNGMTPYEQAKMYNDSLPASQKANWIVLSNFAEIWVINMDTRKPLENIIKINVADLQDKISLLDFLVKKEVKEVSEEVELSIKAGDLVGKIHDRFLKQYNDPMAKRTQNSLNILCVRLVFCLYAEDAGLFGDTDAFVNYIKQYEPKDIRRALLDLFKVLDTPEDARGELYLDEELAKFPYVNGGLFARENIEIPLITQEIKDTLIESAHFNWSKISPTIFGAVFESTLNPETRRAGGMHYTSIENIHKVIDPLFLDELKEELAEIKAITVPKTREAKLRAFQDKLASFCWLDPAAGSGNFLTETYISIRRLENEVLRELNVQISFGAVVNPIKISIDQFYGIEINDFAVVVARAALWIAESQMMRETSDIVHMDIDFLPLKTNATIIEGNALQLDWNKVVNKNELSYIMGNPPFVGYKLQSEAQKKDLLSIFPEAKTIDYVAGWYINAAQMIENTNIRCAFVSTNSIVQGEQVPVLWKALMQKYNIAIDFAYRTFEWDSEANSKAHVHCVIIGFSMDGSSKQKKIFDGNSVQTASIINPYLMDADIVFIEKRNKPICDSDLMVYGSEPREGGYLILSEDERMELLTETPELDEYIKRFVSSDDFINNKVRYCLWFTDGGLQIARKSKIVMQRLEGCRVFRENSKQKQAHQAAETPYLFSSHRQPKTDYLLVPVVSSQNRRYIPIGYLSRDIIASNACFTVSNATLYTFGVLVSNVHNSWMRYVCGRLKSDYRYSNTIVYNNFPWPTPTDEQKTEIEKTAQAILDVRALYPDSSLADLYDPLTMPPELRKAHQANDRAVMEAYGLDVKTTKESDCVAHLMKMYQELAEKEAK